jgi:hypothetical protein
MRASLKTIEERLPSVKKPMNEILTAWHNLLKAMAYYNGNLNHIEGEDKIGETVLNAGRINNEGILCKSKSKDQDKKGRKQFLNTQIAQLNNASLHFQVQETTPQGSQPMAQGGMAALSRAATGLLASGEQSYFVSLTHAGTVPRLTKKSNQLVTHLFKKMCGTNEEINGKKWKAAADQCTEIQTDMPKDAVKAAPQVNAASKECKNEELSGVVARHNARLKVHKNQPSGGGGKEVASHSGPYSGGGGGGRGRGNSKHNTTAKPGANRTSFFSSLCCCCGAQTSDEENAALLGNVVGPSSLDY